ncbi:MAG: hypothetical protein AB8B91_13460 [Rubripirellula sp.]
MIDLFASGDAKRRGSAMRWMMSVLSLLLATEVVLAQRFEVVEPSGLVSGTIEINAGRLLFFDLSGDRVYYSREPRYDTPDRRFVGYFNFDRNRVLRFPRSCSGWMQTADLDDGFPRFRNTISTVRPANARGGGYVGPSFGVPGRGGHGYSSPGYSTGYGYSTPYAGPISPPRPLPYPSGFRAPLQRQSVLIDSEVIPNPPLPNAKIVLRNDGRREVQVAVVDFASERQPQSIRLAPGQSRQVELQRDSGAKRVANYRVITPYGEPLTKEIVSEIPAKVRYEIVVHEWAMQSIAIDRTGTSPNPIEDVNMQGRGIGRFTLPPGLRLQSGTIDVYSAAQRSGNAGTVSPLVPASEQSSDNASVLERTILEAQRAAQRQRGR